MAGWNEIALVLAGSAGPLVITLVSQRAARLERTEAQVREDVRATQSLYAEVVATCTQLDSDWRDYAVFPPRSYEEERELDASRDAHYADLNLLAARIRLTAPPPVVTAAEELLRAVRDVQGLARAAQRGAPDEQRWADHDAAFAAARDRFLAAAKGAMSLPSAVEGST